jgi:hypothetical protein
MLLDVEVLDRAGEEFFFCRHSSIRISMFWSGLARVLCEFNNGRRSQAGGLTVRGAFPDQTAG